MSDDANRALLERSLAAVWHPCTQMKHHEQFPLVALSHGKGVWLYDQDGEKYLDAVSSWWVNLFGHGEPRIQQAIIQQMTLMLMVLFLVATLQ